MGQPWGEAAERNEVPAKFQNSIDVHRGLNNLVLSGA